MTASLVWSALMGSFWVRIAAAVLLAVGALKAYGMHQRYVGRNAAIEQINKKAEKQSAQALKARKHADRPGSAARLQRQHCYDC